MKPLVSILIPAFNAQDWIAETLESAIAQTWSEKEIIVVNDGSTDQTSAIAERFEPAGVRIVTQKNQGAAAARNTAFSLSHGDYIQWLDADDLLSPDKIARQVTVLQEGAGKRALLSSAWGLFMHRHHRAKFVPSSLWCDLSPAEWMIRQMEDNVYMQTATWLVSRELTEAAGPWDTRLLGDDDGEYFSRVLLASEGTRFVPEARVYYRMAGSKSLSYIGRSDKKREAQWLSMQLHIQYLRSVDDSKRARAACVNYLQEWMTAFYPERLDIFEEAEQLARELGGHLEAPILSWKYSWIRAIFGWPSAKRAQILLPRFRWSVQRFWDKTLSHVGT
jgi:glycosyltransferase involved in cell wall biosynthesis